MWGDPEEALRLGASDALSMLLFQVASPAHIPWNDSRWQELLHGAEVWVHVEVRDDPEGVLHQACESMAKHAANSSNLAAFCRLVAQMVDELAPSYGNDHCQQPTHTDQVAEFSERIAIVGKARAAAGSLQLLRIFVHRCLLQYANHPAVLADVFTYRNRDTGQVDSHVGSDLLHSIFHFLTVEKTLSKITQVPELYDAAVLAFQLVLVMLSTQLYQPMLSSFARTIQPLSDTSTKQTDFFLDLIMEEARSRSKRQEQANNSSNGTKGTAKNKKSGPWTPQSLISACLTWQIQRPRSPDRSIARYHYTLARSVVAAKGERVGPDGMYESNLVVSAASALASRANRWTSTSDKDGDSSSSLTAFSNSNRHQPSFFLDATRGVLVQASTIILLPFRLVRLALGLWNHGHNQNGYERSRKSHFNSSLRGSSRTRDVLWITESPIADLATCLFLLLTNNRRAPPAGLADPPQSKKGVGETKEPEWNPFRMELLALTDKRWESGHDSGLPDLPDSMETPSFEESISLVDSFDKEQAQTDSLHLVDRHHHPGKDHTLTLNFETLFLSFGAILHTEVGALAMYTLLRSSRAFSETLAVRSDLDTLVLPLLRTLYFSSTSRHISAVDFSTKAPLKGGEQSLVASETKAKTSAPVSIRTMPFRSQSQLYVIVILLLLFSQDSSFGSDAFRRTIIPSVPWYKERYLKDTSLGSVLLLTLLRSLTFNLNRLHDMFLLGNCCAVMMNLSNSVVDLHDYAAMRLASVTVSCLKKYTSMIDEKGPNIGIELEGRDGSSLLDMYAEVSHTLLSLIKHTLGQKNIERNLGVVYALVYHQADFKKIFTMKNTPFKKSEISRIHCVIKTCAKIIESQSNARTATKALQCLTENIDQIKEAVAEKKKKNTEKEDFTYTYEEEADPETFFVPYIWEVVVCAVTASSVEWDRNKIQVFPLLEAEEMPVDVEVSASDLGAIPAAFATDILDVV